MYYHFQTKKGVKTFFVQLKKPAHHLHSIIDKYPAAELYELEARDLVGVWFDGNPTMEKPRLFLPETMEGTHPLDEARSKEDKGTQGKGYPISSTC